MWVLVEDERELECQPLEVVILAVGQKIVMECYDLRPTRAMECYDLRPTRAKGRLDVIARSHTMFPISSLNILVFLILI